MKYIILFPAFLSLILSAGCVSSSSTSSDTSSAPAMSSVDDSKVKLYIEYSESQPEIRATGYNKMNNENDRFYYLERNFEKVFGEKLSDYTLEFQQFPAKVPEGASVLELTFLSLNSPNRIELELRLWAILKQGSETEDFGVTLLRTVPQRPVTSGSIERDLDEIYSGAAKEIVRKVAEAL